MGKKSKQKKQRQQQQRQKAAQTQPVTLTTTKMVSSPAQATPQVTTGSTTTRPAGLEIGEQYIRRDIIRILILLAIVAVILIALFVGNLHGTYLVNVGHKLAHFARLQ